MTNNSNQVEGGSCEKKKKKTSSKTIKSHNLNINIRNVLFDVYGNEDITYTMY